MDPVEEHREEHPDHGDEATSWLRYTAYVSRATRTVGRIPKAFAPAASRMTRAAAAGAKASKAAPAVARGAKAARVLRLSGRFAKVSGKASQLAARAVARMPRAAKFLGRLRANRLLPHSHEVGEAFEGVASHRMIHAALAVTALYVVGDIASAAWDAHTHAASHHPVTTPPPVDPDHHEVVLHAWPMTQAVVKRTAFHGIASFALPAALIKGAVASGEMAARAMKLSGRSAALLPVVAGLATIPALPYADHPLEHGVDAAFELVLGWPPSEHGPH